MSLVFKVVFSYILIVSVFSFHPQRTFKTYKALRSTLAGSNEDIPNLTSYSGPILDYEYMEAGCTIDDLGLEIMIGPSCVAPGLGLYFRLNDDIDNVTLPRGTPVCGYSKGKFDITSSGDKTVGFAFTNVHEGVMYNKKLIPLLGAINDISEVTEDLTYAVSGHILSYNEVI